MPSDLRVAAREAVAAGPAAADLGDVGGGSAVRGPSNGSVGCWSCRPGPLSLDALRFNALRLHVRPRAAAAQRDYAEGRVLLRAVDALDPDFFAHRTRPGWDTGAARADPTALLAGLTKLRTPRP